MPAGNCIEPWLSHLRFGELEGRRRDDLGGGFRRGVLLQRLQQVARR